MLFLKSLRVRVIASNVKNIKMHFWMECINQPLALIPAPNGTFLAFELKAVY